MPNFFRMESVFVVVFVQLFHHDILLRLDTRSTNKCYIKNHNIGRNLKQFLWGFSYVSPRNVQNGKLGGRGRITYPPPPTPSIRGGPRPLLPPQGPLYRSHPTMARISQLKGHRLHQKNNIMSDGSFYCGYFSFIELVMLSKKLAGSHKKIAV